LHVTVVGGGIWSRGEGGLTPICCATNPNVY